VNVEGTRHLLEAAVRHRVSRFVYCSTVGVHSHISNPPADETTPYNPADMYQRSKMDAEKMVISFFEDRRLRGVILRPAMIYGPGDTRTLKLFKAIAKRQFVYVGDGSAHVHFIDVRDLARAFALALIRKEISGEVFIIAGRESVPLKDLVERIARILKVPPPRLRLPVKPVQLAGSICEALCEPFGINPPLFRRRVDFFTKNRHFTSARAAALLGFEPALSLNQELNEIIDWYSAHGQLGHAYQGKHVPGPTSESFEADDLAHPFDIAKRSLPPECSNRLSRDEALNGEAPSLFLRSLNGTIADWRVGAGKLYGWSRFEAEGRISHHILQTRFPEDLQKINREMLDKACWQGELVHTDRYGREFAVDSSWLLCIDIQTKQKFVLEANRVRSS
jgi:nucleoside-diphosphate-sugar epimerase